MQIKFLTADPDLKQSVLAFVEEFRSLSKQISVQTSGSTGKPKVIELQKDHMEASARMTGSFLSLKEGDSALLCLSPNTIAGKMMIVRSLTMGLELIVTDVNSNPLNEIDDYIDFAAMVPMQTISSLENSPKAFSKINKLIIGGGNISDDLIQKVNKTPVEAYQTFGMTETISHIAMRKLNSEDQFYQALPGVELKELENRLIISASHLGVKDLITNDIVELADNKFRWLGRSDFVINSGGIKIHPELVENRIASLFSAPFFSAGLQDELLGQKHVICTESTDDKLHKEDFTALLDKYLLPKEIYYYDNFVYTESGKINRPETLKEIANAKRKVL